MTNPYEEIERLRKLCGEAAKYVGCGEDYYCNNCPFCKECIAEKLEEVSMYLKLKEASEEK